MNKFKYLFLLILLNIGFCNAQEQLSYNFLNTFSIPIELNITKEISTKNDISEGEILNFRSKKDVFYNGKEIIKKDEIIQGRIENIITSGMNGFPAEIIIDNFQIPNIDSTKIISTYTKTGFNRCYFVFPIKWILTPIPFAGSLTNLIKGGHAKIKTKDTITLHYYPEW